MTILLGEYIECLGKNAPELKDTLESIFQDATKVMSPGALEEYLKGAKGLCELGRSHDIVIAYVEAIPLAVRECGEDIIRDCIGAALKLSSMTSGEVIALLFSSLPTAARRLGDPELLIGYLNLIHQISAKAPRGLRPMLNNIDELLSKLTLSGLKRWAMFGAEAYKRDYKNLSAYFDLKTQDSISVLKKERRGTLFIDTQRKLNFYLRALWGRSFFLRPAATDFEGFKPYLDLNAMHLPDALDGIGKISGLELYRAIAAHAASHIMYTVQSISAEQLSPAQMYFIGIVEDARVEYNAVTKFPGLKNLWKSLLELNHEIAAGHPTLPILEHFSLMLLDSSVNSDEGELNELAAKFHSGIKENAMNGQFSWDIGIELYNIFAKRKEVPSLRLLESMRIPYRDDNRFIWEFSELAWNDKEAYASPFEKQIRRTVNVMEMANEIDNELAGDDAQEIWRLETPFYLDQENCTINELEGTEPVSDPFHYQEWDYQVQLFRPDWATVYERRPLKKDPDEIDAILKKYRPVTHRIKQIIDMLQPEGVQRIRNMEDGDEIDINAAIDSVISMRMGESPNPRITMRNVIKNRDLAVILLLDLSESTNEKAENSEQTILELTKEATALVSTAIQGIGDPFSIHGFSSDGRHDVQYYRFKDFKESFGEDAKARLSGIQGKFSTRMGAAMRHAGAHLLKQTERKKLILLITDGEPADIDERDPQHLRHDTKKAVEELYTKGIMTYCLTLDPNADEYVKRIFGINNYTIIDKVQSLPEKLPALFAHITG